MDHRTKRLSVLGSERPATAAALLVALGCAAGACHEPRTPRPQSTAAPRLERFAIMTTDGRDDGPAVARVTARVKGGAVAEVTLKRAGGREERFPIKGAAAPELDLSEPGDYEIAVTANGTALKTKKIMVRDVLCGGGKHVLSAHELHPARLMRSTHVDYAPAVLEVPRWNARDADPAFLVEWLQDESVVYEERGRDPLFDDVAEAVETSSVPNVLAPFCSFQFGERYNVPTDKKGRSALGAGAWEVRIHREGQPSVATRFVMPAGGKHAAEDGQEEAGSDKDELVANLHFEPIDTPAPVRALLARMPSACREICSAITFTRVGPPGEYTWGKYGNRSFDAQACRERTPPAPHRTHNSAPYPFAFSPAELRAAMRSREAFAERDALTKMFFHGPSAVDRPDFEYDPNVSPEANWHRRKAWEASDVAGQAAQEQEAKARAMALVPPLQKTIREQGTAPWRDAEIPAAPFEIHE